MFSFLIIASKVLRLSACKTMQVVYLLDRGYADVRYYGLKRCFPWVKKLGFPAKNVRVAFRRIFTCESGNNCWFTDVNVSISWLLVRSIDGIDVITGSLLKGVSCCAFLFGRS